MDPLHLITVIETAETNLSATSAELSVSVSGQSFFAGSEALKKAAEVCSLVDALKQAGVSDDDISIKNVSTSVESGLLTKSSSATYHLVVKVSPLDLLGPAISAIASQKNTQMSDLRWRYSDLQTRQNELLRAAVRQAKATAESIADSLGTNCSAVHQLSYDFHGLNQDPSPRNFGKMRKQAMAFSAMERDATDALDFEHTANLHATVTAQFVVAPFAN